MEGRDEDLGYRILALERRLSAYQKVHAEEFGELRRLLSALKDDVLASRAGEGTMMGDEEAPGSK